MVGRRFALAGRWLRFARARKIMASMGEAFFVLEGEYLMFINEQQTLCPPGTFVYVPRATPHTFKVLSAGPGSRPDATWRFLGRCRRAISEYLGPADPGFTLKVYTREPHPPGWVRLPAFWLLSCMSR
jgi:hypothetical protein